MCPPRSRSIVCYGPALYILLFYSVAPAIGATATWCCHSVVPSELPLSHSFLQCTTYFSSLIDMFLLSLCARRAHSATCSLGTCGLWPFILAHLYLSTTHSLLSQRSAFCVLGRGRLRAWVLVPTSQRESTCN